MFKKENTPRMIEVLRAELVMVRIQPVLIHKVALSILPGKQKVVSLFATFAISFVEMDEIDINPRIISAVKKGIT